ncbi:TPA: hypothetical protein EYP66_11805 [Candidatus Poribacteria bacterium]|nr:hypothetical protein [Candidatus Poribacteria bacterium]
MTQFVEQEKRRQKGNFEKIIKDALHLLKRAEETVGDEKYNPAYLEAYRVNTDVQIQKISGNND